MFTKTIMKCKCGFSAQVGEAGWVYKSAPKRGEMLIACPACVEKSKKIAAKLGKSEHGMIELDTASRFVLLRDDRDGEFTISFHKNELMPAYETDTYASIKDAAVAALEHGAANKWRMSKINQ